MSPPIYASAGKATRKRTASKLTVVSLAQAIALPAAAAVFILYKYVLKKGPKKATPPAPAKSEKPSAPAKAKPRRDVKVKRDPEAAAIARAIARAEAAAGLTRDDKMEVLHEEDVDALHGAEAVGAVGAQALQQGDGNFIKMLQGLGYKLVVNEETGQAFLVPPGGAEGEGDEPAAGTSQARQPAAPSQRHAARPHNQPSSSEDGKDLLAMGESGEEDEWEQGGYIDAGEGEGSGEGEEGQWGRYLRDDELGGDDLFDAMLDDLDPEFGDMLMPDSDFAPDAPSMTDDYYLEAAILEGDEDEEYEGDEEGEEEEEDA